MFVVARGTVRRPPAAHGAQTGPKRADESCHPQCTWLTQTVCWKTFEENQLFFGRLIFRGGEIKKKNVAHFKLIVITNSPGVVNSKKQTKNKKIQQRRVLWKVCSIPSFVCSCLFSAELKRKKENRGPPISPDCLSPLWKAHLKSD